MNDRIHSPDGPAAASARTATVRPSSDASLRTTVERLERGISAYRRYRRRRRNPTLVDGQAASGTPHRTTETLVPGTKWATPIHRVDAPADGPTAFVLAGQHGIEPAGWKAAEALLELTPESGTLVVVPRADQTAIAAGTYAGDEGSLNDLWNGSDEPTAEIGRVVWDRFETARPDVAFDLHSSEGIYESGVDDGVGQAIFPTPGRARDVAAAVTETLNEEYVRDWPDHYDYVLGNLQSGWGRNFSHKVGGHYDGAGCLLCEPTRRPTSEGRQPSEAERIRWNLASVVLALDQYGMTFEESV